MVYTSERRKDSDPDHILSSIDYFSPAGFPETSYHRLIPVVGFLDKETHRLLRFQPKADLRWTVFHIVHKLPLTIFPNSTLDNRGVLTRQIRESVIGMFGDLDKSFNVKTMAKALSFNRIQCMIVNHNFPATVFLPSWLMVDRNYLLPEPELEVVDWMEPFDIQVEIIKDHQAFHPLTVTHLCMESKS